MRLPRAAIASVPWTHRLRRWAADHSAPPAHLCGPGRFAAALAWSASGALAAGCALAMYAIVVSGAIWTAGPTLAIGGLAFGLFGVSVLFWPFVCSWLAYWGTSRFRLMRNRAAGAAFGAAWHLGAQTAVIDAAGGSVSSWMMIVPVSVGGLWGSWLPASVKR